MDMESTFMSFLLKHQQKHKRTLNFLILMESILTAAKQIREFYRDAELHRATGAAALINVQGEQVMQMDEIANKTVIHCLKESDQVLSVVSEELEQPLVLNANGRYLLYIDPLDGSSNIKHSLPVGFLFGIAKRNLEGEEDLRLRTGREYIAAGMFLLPSGQFTFALKGAGAWRFVMDDSGTYIRPSQVLLPETRKQWELSWNAGNRHTFATNVQRWIAENERDFSFRYTGSLAVDFHRLLHNGGMFMYPAIVQHPDPKKNRPEGKLRLMYECNVVAFIAEEAGGKAIAENGQDVLDLVPEKPHQRSAIFVGNSEVVQGIRSCL